MTPCLLNLPASLQGVSPRYPGGLPRLGHDTPSTIVYTLTRHRCRLFATMRLMPAGTSSFDSEHAKEPRHERGIVPDVPGLYYGAFLSLLLAIRAPQLVRTLVLAEPPVITLFVSNEPQPQEILRLLITRPRTAVAILKFGAQGLTPAKEALRQGDRDRGLRLLGRATLGPDAFQGLSKARLEQARANLIDAELLGSGFSPLEDDDLRTLDVPALLLNGQESPGLFHRLTDRLEELLPQSERIEIPGASHIMHEDNPEAYNRAVLSFLAKHRQAARRPVSQRKVPVNQEAGPGRTRA